ncbi:hypothetical protein [Shimia abyssi]|uniref:D-alanine-D-alanine ligase-like ATP-grasp enzyme n=1 Tax=Shimia abyssi TaxID=1662395 RepID=A0A2P8F770_9RHOB|nr:hypothetical protein [Shimia abyssi]PSL17565.1 D-alanine-D-alanine ligase-like ATP-grasp enzyme [Shimia abyssi]
MKIFQSQAKIYTGYVRGLRQPAYSANLTFAPSPEDPQRLSGSLQNILLMAIAPMNRPGWQSETKCNSPEEELAQSICTAVAQLQDAAGIPITDAAHIQRVSDPLTSGSNPENKLVFRLDLPSQDPQVAKIALSWVILLLSELTQNPQKVELTSEQKRMLDLFMAIAKKSAPPGANNARMLRAAAALEIPVLKLPHNIFQYGWGKNSRLFQSTFSDATPTIATQLCGDKDLTKAVLSSAGIPVPAGFLPTNSKHAVKIAETLGYPVIVKPADTERGIGITGNLNSAQEVLGAYGKARKHSRRVLVEKYLSGTTFRVNIYAGKVSSIIKKVPASVFGDGRSTIEQLICAENKARKVLQAEFAQVKPIELDQEAEELLQAQGFISTSIPSPDTEVFLKQSANVSSGGRLIEFNAPVHPETLDMLERACAILRLDLGGIDLISDDLERPWYETETAILEINSKPQLSAIHFENGQKLLNLYVPDQGHIPTVVFVSSLPQAENETFDFLSLFAGTQTGLAIRGRAFVGSHSLQRQKTDDIRAINAVLMNPSAESVMLVTDGSEHLKQGFPLPFYDVLAIGDWTEDCSLLETLIQSILPFLKNKLVIDRAHPLVPAIRDLVPPNRLWLVENKTALLNAVKIHLTQ